MLNRVIDKYFSLPIYGQWFVLLMVSGISGIAITQKSLHPIFEKNAQFDLEYNQLRSQIEWYQNHQLQIKKQLLKYSRLIEQLHDLDQKLNRYKKLGPEKILIGLALQAGVVPDHIEITQQGVDEYGQFVRISMAVQASEIKIYRFFDKLLAQQQLIVWEKLVFDRREKESNGSQLTMSIVARHYLDLGNYETK